MSKTVLFVGTRKGAFVLEATATGANGRSAGRTARAGPSTTRSTSRRSGAIYAAAASEWHGAAVWRSPDLGETWTLSSEGIAYEDGRKLSKVSTLAASKDRVLVGVEAPGIFESRDDGQTWSLKTTLSGQPGSEGWDNPENQPPGHLGISAMMLDRDDPSHWWAIVQGNSLFETTDDAQSWTPRNRGLRATGPPSTRRSASASTSSCDRPTRTGCTSRITSACTAPTTPAHTWTEITDGLPTEFGFAAAAHPHDKDTFYVVPLDPGHGRTMPDGQAAVWRTRDAGSKWQRLDKGLPQEGAYVGVLREGMAIDATTRRASTSARAPGKCSRASTKATAGTRSRLPAGDLVRRGSGCGLTMADVRLPGTLAPLFQGCRGTWTSRRPR